MALLDNMFAYLSGNPQPAPQAQMPPSMQQQPDQSTFLGAPRSDWRNALQDFGTGMSGHQVGQSFAQSFGQGLSGSMSSADKRAAAETARVRQLQIDEQKRRQQEFENQLRQNVDERAGRADERAGRAEDRSLAETRANIEYKRAMINKILIDASTKANMHGLNPDQQIKLMGLVKDLLDKKVGTYNAIAASDEEKAALVSEIDAQIEQAAQMLKAEGGQTPQSQAPAAAMPGQPGAVTSPMMSPNLMSR